MGSSSGKLRDELAGSFARIGAVPRTSRLYEAPPTCLARALAFLAALPACAAWIACAADPNPQRPDVCILLIDTLRADHLGVYGYPRRISANLDAFASKAIVFADAFAPSPWTMPSVGSLMTGTYPSVHGLRARTGDAVLRALRPELPTLAEAMRDAGYRTVALIANPWASPKQGLHKGFDEYEVFDKDTSAANLSYVARQVLDRNDSRPVFLYVHYMDGHGPYDAAPVPPGTLGPIPETLARPLTSLERRSIPLYLRLPAASTLATYIHAYDSGIYAWDRAFGEWLAWLDETGRRKKTIVSVTADHGEEFLDHGGWSHGTNLHQESLRIPWILHIPGHAPQRITDRAVSLVDVAPTLLAAVGAETPAGMDGRNVLGDDPAGDLRPLFAETEIKVGGFPGVRQRSVRRGARKLIRFPNEASCYDLSLDPAEQHPLEGDSACEHELAAALDAWEADVRKRAAALGPSREERVTPGLREHLRALGYTE